MDKAKKYVSPKSVKITKGPQKFELVMSLFDLSMWNFRTVAFLGKCRYLKGKSYTYLVSIISIERGVVLGDFEIRGYLATPTGHEAVIINYSTETLKGVLIFEAR